MTSGLEFPAPAGIAFDTGGRRKLRRAFWGVMLAFLVHGLVVSTWVSRIASVKSALRLSDGVLGLALLGVAVGSIAAIPISGALVTRFGSRRIAQWTSAGFCFSLVPLALAGNLPMLIVGLVVYGIMAGANDVAMNAQAVGTEKLLTGPAMSRFHALFSLGGIAGAGIGSVMAGRGVSPAVHLTAAAAGIVVLVAAAGRMMMETREGSGPPAHAAFKGIPIALVALSAIGFCIFLSEGAIADWTAVYLKQVLLAGDGLAAAGYAVFSAAMAVFRLLGDAITLRIGRPWTIRLGGSLAAAGLAVVCAAQSPHTAMAGFAAAGAGFSSIIPLVFAAGGRIPGVAEGAGVATVSGLGYLGFLVGPPAIGFISELSSLRWGLFLLVLLSASAAAMVSMVERGSHGDGPLD